MHIDEARVMKALTSGEHRSLAELAELTGLAVRRVRTAVHRLQYCGFLTRPTAGMRPSTWALSQPGNSFATSPQGRTTLDVPASPRSTR